MIQISSRVKRVAGFLVPAGVLAIISVDLWRHSAQLRQYHWNLSLALLATSYVALFTGFMLVVFVWKLLLRKLGMVISYRRAFEIWYTANLGRYLPGKIWGVVGMVYLCEKEGLPKSKVLASGVITQLFSITTAFMLGSAYLGFARLPAFKSITVWFPLLLASLGVLMVPLVFPDFCSRCLNRVWKRFAAQEIRITLQPADRVRFFGLHTLCWLVYGVAFGFFVLAINRLPYIQLFSLVPTFALAYTLGFIAVFAPSGFGVREGVMALLLSSVFPLTIAFTIALAARIWFSLGEVLFFVIAWQLQTGIYAHIGSTLRRPLALLRPRLGPERRSSDPFVHTATIARPCNGSEYSDRGRET